MHIAIYSAFFSPTSIAYIKTVIEYLNANDHQFILVDRLKKHLGEEGETYDYFKDDVALEKKVDFLFSVGGDGTLLRSIAVIRDSKIPILGINAGRLGFLTSIKKDTLQDGLDLFFQGNYSIVERSLLAVATKEPTEALQEFGFALNEVTINRKNTTSMLSIHTKLNDQFLTTYWSDGLIIATPTGSTGYSLSCNGPVISPNSKNLIITPIAPHNLNARPMVIPDDTFIELEVDSREKSFLISLDSRITSVPKDTKIYIEKSPFTIKSIIPTNQSFLTTLRTKLLWGEDTRNGSNI